MHPNDEGETDDFEEERMKHDAKKKKKGCKGWFARLDYEKLRPFLIYKYEWAKMHKEAEIIENF